MLGDPLIYKTTTDHATKSLRSKPLKTTAERDSAIERQSLIRLHWFWNVVVWLVGGSYKFQVVLSRIFALNWILTFLKGGEHL